MEFYMVKEIQKTVKVNFSLPEDVIDMLDKIELDLKLKSNRPERVKIKKSRIIADLIRKEYKRHFKK